MVVITSGCLLDEEGLRGGGRHRAVAMPNSVHVCTARARQWELTPA